MLIFIVCRQLLMQEHATARLLIHFDVNGILSRPSIGQQMQIQVVLLNLERVCMVIQRHSQ